MQIVPVVDISHAKYYNFTTAKYIILRFRERLKICSSNRIVIKSIEMRDVQRIHRKKDGHEILRARKYKHFIRGDIVSARCNSALERNFSIHSRFFLFFFSIDIFLFSFLSNENLIITSKNVKRMVNFPYTIILWLKINRIQVSKKGKIILYLRYYFRYSIFQLFDQKGIFFKNSSILQRICLEFISLGGSTNVTRTLFWPCRLNWLISPLMLQKFNTFYPIEISHFICSTILW